VIFLLTSESYGQASLAHLLLMEEVTVLKEYSDFHCRIKEVERDLTQSS
jgi:hypothetical protein